jgi:hypothetical protein
MRNLRVFLQRSYQCCTGSAIRPNAADSSKLQEERQVKSRAGWRLALFHLAGCCDPAQAPDPLPSWNDRVTKPAILNFVKVTTDPSSLKPVPPEQRIATFDRDGTTWVEHPMYTQLVYCPERAPELVKAKPALTSVEPFRTILSGDREAIAKLPTYQFRIPSQVSSASPYRTT